VMSLRVAGVARVPAVARGVRQRRGGGHDGRQVPGEPVQLGLGGRGQRLAQAVVELVDGQPALGEALPQLPGGHVPFGVAHAQARAWCHPILRMPRAPLLTGETIYLVNWYGKLKGRLAGYSLRRARRPGQPAESVWVSWRANRRSRREPRPCPRWRTPGSA